MAPGIAEKIRGNSLWELGEKSIRELEADRGILASARTEVYGCIFGRDSLISALSLLRVYETTRDTYYLDLVRKILVNLAALQGSEVNIESGEEPGKIIHEYRESDHDRLSKQLAQPWHVYGDGVLRNYDSVDSTPLFLIAAHAYFCASGDEACIDALMPSIRAALRWLEEYGDTNGDGFIDYRFHPDRKSGGLRVQSWMDSTESLFFEGSGERPKYPIAPVEVQAYAFAAFCAWSNFFETSDAAYARTLRSRADDLKTHFNRCFVRCVRKRVSLVTALDGEGRALHSARSSMGHCLWAASCGANGIESVLHMEYIEPLVQRLLARDLFVARAGIRTLSSRSSHFDPMSYHNGSIWPHDTAMIAEGFENFGFYAEAQLLRAAHLESARHFSTPIELFAYTRGAYREYSGACRTQAWSAASLLTTVLKKVN